MKKFKLVSNSIVTDDGRLLSKQRYVKYDSYADVIQEIESNAGWYTDEDSAFKVAYIKEVME